MHIIFCLKYLSRKKLSKEARGCLINLKTFLIEKKYNFFEENPQYKERGEMRVFLKGHQLMRENFYLSNDQGISNIKQVDEHEMIFESSYNDWYILEHTRLVDSDNYRFRVIYSWNKNKLKIVENHHEIKIIK